MAGRARGGDDDVHLPEEAPQLREGHGDALKRRGIASPDYADALMLTYVDPPAPPRLDIDALL